MGQFSFANLAAKTATVTVDFGEGNVLHVDYSPDRLTSRFAIEMAALSSADTSSSDGAKMQANLTAAIDALLQLVTSWDAEEPLSRDSLLDLPVTILNQLFTAIMQDQAGEALAPTA